MERRHGHSLDVSTAGVEVVLRHADDDERQIVVGGERGHAAPLAEVNLEAALPTPLQ
jgi:hypothetical protein